MGQARSSDVYFVFWGCFGQHTSARLCLMFIAQHHKGPGVGWRGGDMGYTVRGVGPLRFKLITPPPPPQCHRWSIIKDREREKRTD